MTKDKTVRKTLFGMMDVQPAFASVDATIATQYECPKCSYAWSGRPRPGDDSEAKRGMFDAASVAKKYQCPSPSCRHEWNGKPRLAVSFGDVRKDVRVRAAFVGEKPPYRVPLVSETNALPKNGLTVASTFSGTGGSCYGYKMAGYRVLWANEFVPAAQDSYRANFPEVVLDPRSIYDVRPAEILKACGLKKGELDLFDGSPPCFAAGTPVVTHRGIVPVESVTVGDLVLTHEGRWKPVVRTMSRRSPTAIVAGRIEATAEHPFYARSQIRGKNHSWKLGKPEWTRAENLQGLFLAIPAQAEMHAIPEAPEDFAYDPAFWYIVGRWLGDGWVRLRKGDPVQTTKDRPKQNDAAVSCVLCGKPSRENERLPGKYTNYCSAEHAAKHKRSRRRCARAETLICTGTDDAVLLSAALEKLGIPFCSADSPSGTKFTISRGSLARWLSFWFGKGAAKKTIPGWVLGMAEEHRAALFSGYDAADGDGSQATTISRCLASGIALLAASLGKTVGISGPYQNTRSEILGRKINARPQWCVRYKDDDGRYTRVENGIRWKKLRRPIESGTDSAVVYDLEVEEDHSFVADIFVVHNCQAFSTAGRREKGWGKDKQYEHGARQKNEDLFFEYVRLLKGLKPKTFVAENVSGLVKGSAKGYFKMILAALEACGYKVAVRVLDAQWLGVPQMRQRAIFVGVRNDLGLDPAFPEPLPYRYTVRDALPWILRQRVKGSTTEKFDDEEWCASDARPSGAILSTDAIRKESARNSTGGWVEARVLHKPAGNHASQGDVTDRPCPTILVGHGDHPFEVEEKVFATGPANVRRVKKGTRRPVNVAENPSPTITTTVPEFSLSKEVSREVVHDTSGKGGKDGFNSYSAGVVTDKPCPTITIGVNSLNSLHFQVVEKEEPAVVVHNPTGIAKKPTRHRIAPTVMAEGIGGVARHQYYVDDAGEIPANPGSPCEGSYPYSEINVNMRRPGRLSKKSHFANDVSPTVSTSSPDFSLEYVEPETRLCPAVGAEWDKTAAGAASDKFFSLVKPDTELPCGSVTAVGGTGAAGVCHPVERRKFSIAELRRICGFPDDFVLTGSYAQQWARLGNAVPPVMMLHIASAIRDAILLPAKRAARKKKR